MIHSVCVYDIYHNEVSLANSDKYVPSHPLGNRDIFRSDFCNGHVRLTTCIYLTSSKPPENSEKKV